MSTLLKARHDPRLLSLITPRRGGTEHGCFRKGKLWPRSPRNFAAEPATWNDLGVQQQAIGADDDASFLLDFYWTSNVLSDRRVLYNAPLSSRFSIFSYSNGMVNVFTNLIRTPFIAYVSLTVVGTGSGLSVGRHRISARVEGTTFYAKLDDNEELFISGTRSYVTSFTAPVSEAPMTIYEAWERNDSANKKVWSYPSESEKLGLLSQVNTLAGDQCFEAANPAVAARIDSQIDLRGVVSDYTVAVDFEAVEFTATKQAQNLAGQGASVAGQLAICSLGYYRLEDSYLMQLSHEISGTRTLYAPYIAQLSGRNIAVGRIRTGSSTTELSLYLNGELLGSKTVTGMPTGAAYPTYTSYAINDSRNGLYTNFSGKIYAAALFNQALSAEQIASLSK